MYNDIKRGSLANALALHYFDSSEVNSKDLFYFIEKWILSHGLIPTKMSGKGSKTITFTRGKKALEKENFLSLKQRSLEIYALPNEDEIHTETFDSIMDVHYRNHQDVKKNGIVFCWDDTLIPWENSYIKTLLKDTYEFCKPQYGYAFQRDFKKGPGYYPWGVGTGSNISWEEGEEIMNWSNVGLGATHSKYQPQMIRDVYPLNFLSPQHFKAQIGTQTLEQWIQSDPTRGSLEELLPDFWCWSVEPQNIDSVKEALKPHNLLIAHMEF